MNIPLILTVGALLINSLSGLELKYVENIIETFDLNCATLIYQPEINLSVAVKFFKLIDISVQFSKLKSNSSLVLSPKEDNYFVIFKDTNSLSIFLKQILVENKKDIFEENKWFFEVDDLNTVDWEFGLESEVYLVLKNSQNRPELYESYSIPSRGNIVNKIGHWSKSGHLIMTSKSKWERRGDLRGVTLRAIAYDFSPFHNIVNSSRFHDRNLNRALNWMGYIPG